MIIDDDDDDREMTTILDAGFFLMSENKSTNKISIYHFFLSEGR